MQLVMIWRCDLIGCTARSDAQAGGKRHAWMGEAMPMGEAQGERLVAALGEVWDGG